MEIVRTAGSAGRYIFKHLSLLAAHRPAISGLEPVAFASGAGRSDGETLLLIDFAAASEIPAGFSDYSIAMCARGLQSLNPNLSDGEAREKAIHYACAEVEKSRSMGPRSDPDSEALHLATQEIMKERGLTYRAAAEIAVDRRRRGAA